MVNLLVSMLVFLFLLDSGSWFGIQNAAITDILFFGLSCSIWLISKKRGLNRTNFYIAAFFLLTFWANYYRYFYDSPAINGYISYSLRLISTLLMCSIISFDDFCEKYVSNLFLISIVSLTIYIAFSYLHLIAGVTEDGYYYMVLNLFRVYRNYRGSMYRNASIFWEPGAYQLFVNLAIAMIMRRNHFIFSKKWRLQDYIYLIVFLVCIISTFSTTGYLMTSVILGAVILKTFKEIKKLTKIIIGIPMVVFSAYILFLVAQSEVVAGKISGDNTASLLIRTSDIIASVKMIISRPIMGYGFDTKGMWNQLMASGRTTYNNSSGFLMLMCTFGVPCGVLYFLKLIKHARIYWKDDKIIFLCLVIFSGFTEGFCLYPIYYSFLFRYKGGELT